MNQEQKNQISDLLQQRIKDMQISQNAVAKMINGISAATINAIVNKGWQSNDKLISKEMWTRVSAWLGIVEGWRTVESDANYKKIYNLCHHTQKKSHSKAIVGEPGVGKSHTLKSYSQKNGNVFYVECAEYYSKRVFLNKLRQAMGLGMEPTTTQELVEQIIDHLKTTTRPLIILDEADKLKDPVLALLPMLYNETLGHCGFMIAGAPYLEKRIRKGVRMDRQCYKEILSRVGGEFKTINSASYDAVEKICLANGINNPEVITRIANRSNGDLRAVKSAIENELITN